MVYLTEPCLTPTFSEEILYVTCRHAQDSPTLPLIYYQAVSPPLVTQKTLDAYFEALCRLSIVEAYHLTRSRDDSTRWRLLEHLVSFAYASPSEQERAARATKLMGLPLTSDEQVHMETFIREGSGKNLRGAKESLLDLRAKKSKAPS